MSLIVHKPGLVVTGFPLESINKGKSAEIRFPDDTVIEAQVKKLLPKWVELSFNAKQAGKAEVEFSGREPDGNYIASEDEDMLDNGLVQVKLNRNPSLPPVEICWDKCSGTLKPEITVNGRQPVETGVPREIKIIRNGALRCRVEISGSFVDSMNYRIRLELWKDNPALQVDWLLAHEIPNIQEIKVEHAALTGDWKLGGNNQRVFLQQQYTTEYVPRIVYNPEPVKICADKESFQPHIKDYAMLLDDSVYPFYYIDSIGTTAEWLQLHGNLGAVCGIVNDFIQTMPNALSSENNFLTYEFVPEGESLNWPQGRRKEQSLVLSFSSTETDINNLVKTARDSFRSGKAQPDSESIGADFDCDLLPSDVNVYFNHILDQLCEINSPAGKWNIGDTPDAHYTRGYGAHLNQYRTTTENCPPKIFSTKSGIYPDSSILYLEPVWTNNEYDIIHTIASEVMRTGKARHFDMLRLAVRHNIEIDFISYSDDPKRHQASPFHSHFHNRKGTITSHFWTQGLMQYYCMTGDDDALETALALGRKIIEINHSGISANWSFDREIGWALLSLVPLLDAGFEEFRDEAKKIVDFLMNYDRKSFSGAIKLSAGQAGRSMERQIIDCAFGYAAMIEALDRYQRMTCEQKLADWLDELLFQLKDAFWEKVKDTELPYARHMTGLIMAIGYERTGNKDFLNAGELILQYYQKQGFSFAAGTEHGEVKACAMTYRGLARLFNAFINAGQSEKFEFPALLEHYRETL